MTGAGPLLVLDGRGVARESPAADVVWVYRRGRRRWLDEWRTGQASGEFFYGLLSLRHRYRVGFVEADRVSALRLLWHPVDRLIARRMGMGFALDLALANLPTLNRARVVISTVDASGLPLAVLKRAGLLGASVIYISQGLSDRIAGYGPDRWLARQYRRALLGVERLAVFSAGAAAALAAWLEIPSERVQVVPFGTDCEFWRSTTPGDAGGPDIVSVGSDPGRDYATLLNAAGDLRLHVVTTQPLPLDGRPTVRRTTSHTPRELRDIYCRARFVVIPLHDRSQPSGQSAALQAMSCGKAVILTRTRGFWGEPHLRDGENCVLVPPADPEALAGAIRRLWSDPAACVAIGHAARETVARHFTEPRMAEALAALIESHR